MSLRRDAVLVVALLQTGCGRTTGNGVEQAVATAAASTSESETSSTDAAATTGAVATTQGSAGGASSNSASMEGSAGGGAPTASVDISGYWAMFRFEDPVAVYLEQDGTALHGTGCCAGMTFDYDYCCAPIAGGSIEGRHVQFGFPVDLGPGIYMADVFVSEDGERMAGPFHHLGGWGPPTAWLRIASGEVWLPRANLELTDQLSSYVGSFTLALTGTEPVGVFSPNVDYSLRLTNRTGVFVSGDLGSFWEGELSWDESTETLLAGPVPESHPDLPIELRSSFTGTELLEVVATLPAGEIATFSANRN